MRKAPRRLLARRLLRAVGLLLPAALLIAAALAPRAPAASPAPGVETTAPTPALTPARTVGRSPLTRAQRPTTSGEIALRNLEGTIGDLERAVARDTARPAERRALVEMLLTRAAVLGRLRDYFRAAELGEDAVRRAPRDPEAYLLRADIRAALHRFDDALADLAEAERRGLPKDSGAPLRAEILRERGRLDEALALRRKLNASAPDILGLGAEASLRAEQGATEDAERLFVAAQHHYRDVSPFPFAWLYLQQGLMWERLGTLPRARELFEAALARLPGYAPAIGHLAAVERAAGNRARAIELLRPLVASSDDPEYAGQLATLLRETGETGEAARLRDRAAARFDELTTTHAAAFALKAARFWLGVGDDPEKALALAELNLRVRQGREDRQAVADARAAVAARHAN